jgi:hypothetical protein
MPFWKVSIRLTVAGSAPVFSTVHAKTPAGRLLARYSCGMTGDTWRQVNRSPGSGFS